MQVCWTDVEEIAELLEENYPEIDILQLRFTILRKMIVDLEEFADNPEHCNEKVLEKIQQEWYSLREENEDNDEE
ncbi:Fe-S cluster assembly protein IscX [Rickettsiales endosymbiont of Stachyamoeba lipophora]|uniref:Fe-S cluster assembly protein IscX n=1 Tax=Rickettsiales endosymbiont of Stachyamoeba lipophora TaxID=2486578 RepID=UPI000F652D07|nr:Fe-S cluster assembly protein IscX [Rickettsiales endosymbiont of Stachyamoeba lipophora]AZL15177.1 Fe-S assembly protein IscX [Rickettsiales endosymbiont of Stachyamoeba lipophora]